MLARLYNRLARLGCKPPRRQSRKPRGRCRPSPYNLRWRRLACERLERREVLSTSMATGDFDGDGFDDLAVGVPLEDVRTGQNNFRDAGAVNVVYGSGGIVGDPEGGLVNPGNQLWTQDTTGILDSSEGDDPQITDDLGDQFGFALAAGDFDGDGFDDLAVGVPGEDRELPNGAVLRDIGAVNVIYGTAAGLAAAGNQFFHRDVTAVAGAAEQGDFFGQALAVGDFNFDGYDDLAIGVPGDNNNAGAVQVIYGSARGLDASTTGARDDQIWHQDTAGVEGRREANDRFGFSLAAGDFNDDGYDDLAIGVPLENVSGIRNAGAVNVIYGSPSGLSATFVADQIWTQEGGTGEGDILGEAEQGDQFGYAVEVGNFNGDRFDDLAVGAPFEDVRDGNNNVPDAGSVNVIYGAATGLDDAGNQIWHQATPGILDKPEIPPAGTGGDQFGFALAAGSFNGDRFDDLAIGVPGEDIGTKRDAGAVNVIYGRAGTGLHELNDQFWSQDTKDIAGTAAANDEFGSALAAGLFNDDIYADLAIGVPGDDFGGINDSGAVNVIYGSAARLVSGLGSGIPNNELIHQSSLGRGTAEANDRFSGGRRIRKTI